MIEGFRQKRTAMNDKIPKIERPEPPDKSLFMTMMGAFFLCFAVAPTYWSYYNYGEYKRTNVFVQELKSKSEQFLTADEKKEKENRIYFLESGADRNKLEMILSGAGAFVLFGISLLFFRKALKSRGVKPNYAALDRRTISFPIQRVEVKYKRYYGLLFAFIAVFFIGMAVLISYQSLTSQFESANGKIIKGVLFPIALFSIPSVVGILIIRAKRRAVRVFDNSGITRGDGRHFAWNEFRGVVTQTARNRYRQKYTWREELIFDNGEQAWIIPNRVKNYAEVSNYISHLPRAVSR